jgi:hypothetical protein
MDVFEKVGTFDFVCRESKMKLRFQKSSQSRYMSMLSAGDLDNVDNQQFYVAKGLPQPFGHPTFQQYVTITVSSDKKSVERIATSNETPSNQVTTTPGSPTNSRVKYTLGEDGNLRQEMFASADLDSEPFYEDICDQVADLNSASNGGINRMDVFEEDGTFNFVCKESKSKIRFQKSPQSRYMSMLSAAALDNVDNQQFYVAKGLPQPFGHPTFQQYVTITVSSDKKSVERVATSNETPSNQVTTTPGSPTNSRVKYTLRGDGNLRHEIFASADSGSELLFEDICEQVADFN